MAKGNARSTVTTSSSTVWSGSNSLKFVSNADLYGSILRRGGEEGGREGGMEGGRETGRGDE